MHNTQELLTLPPDRDHGRARLLAALGVGLSVLFLLAGLLIGENAADGRSSDPATTDQALPVDPGDTVSIGPENEPISAPGADDGAGTDPQSATAPGATRSGDAGPSGGTDADGDPEPAAPGTSVDPILGDAAGPERDLIELPAPGFGDGDIDVEPVDRVPQDGGLDVDVAASLEVNVTTTPVIALEDPTACSGGPTIASIQVRITSGVGPMSAVMSWNASPFSEVAELTASGDRRWVGSIGPFPNLPGGPGAISGLVTVTDADGSTVSTRFDIGLETPQECRAPLGN